MIEAAILVERPPKRDPPATSVARATVAPADRGTGDTDAESPPEMVRPTGSRTPRAIDGTAQNVTSRRRWGAKAVANR